ncbi:transcription factor [Pseudovibrio sp. Tun.PSC04-5.I4]|uniref:HTH-like domain-containing protein n=1 Tax=Pseudovibrio sp. Tun.PSC04-5.I4 TaxID=1798213 RepID=UPI000881AE0B|nr:transcription factor [Pseudovibrio sp. Tun.PSC04-5.I4]SDQ32697.1 hypothetical protein SAMN04515695_0858 [Pseudovibrio sp. Tun.PSC04-5.I4]
MTKLTIYQSIKTAISNAPRNQRTLEIHLQMLKYADDLPDVSGVEFCKMTELSTSFGAEFSKMRNLTKRLKRAGLDVGKL